MATAVSSRARTEDEITAGLLAMVQWAGNASAASRSLESESGIKIDRGTLARWANEVHADRYEELREKYAEQLEERLVEQFRNNTHEALEVQRLAVEAAKDRLDAKKDDDPARTAANLARVAQSNTDKMQMLLGRPTVIKETRSPEEILRSLAQMGVIKAPDVVDGEIVQNKELTSGTGNETASEGRNE